MATYLIHTGPNPTSDFYFPERNTGNDILLSDVSKVRRFSNTDNLIFIRYINKEWRRYLSQTPAEKRPNIIFFIDDDVFDIKVHKGLSWRYRWKLYNLAARHQEWLKKINAQLWVSTTWLEKKYKDWSAIRLFPKNPYRLENDKKLVIFYHGSASHLMEIKWLYPVIENVLNATNNVTFELIGTAAINRIFKNIKGVHVVHPMTWYSYRDFIQTPGRIIGLAPLLDSPFNHARSASKFFDITQAGAVGIYADSAVYQEKITHLHNGLLVAMQPELWVERILWLVNNPEARMQLWENARRDIYVKQQSIQ